MSEKRLVYIQIFFVFCALVLQINMVRIICSDYYISAQNQTNKTIQISSGRAEIVDSSFRPITGTESVINTLVETNTTNLQDIFNSLPEEDRQEFTNAIENYKRMIVELKEPIKTQTMYLTSKRYSDNNIAQHLIGYIDVDNNGVTGIEKAFDEKLKDSGEIIDLHLKVNGVGDIYGDINQSVSVREDVLSLTIDNTMQRLAESVANEYIENGSIVIMETNTGKILAMASTPTYNANDIESYLESENSPLLNKALQTYEPGSVIKPLWAALALENGHSEHTIYECKGYTEVNGHIYHCFDSTAHGLIDMNEALRVSCNSYFVDLFYENKEFSMKNIANQMNFGQEIELAENYFTKNGYFPTLEEIENIGQLSQVSFGQGEFLVSPIHITAYMNMFANGGKYIYPQISQGIYDSVNYDLIENLYEYNEKQVISKETADIIKEMLITVAMEGNSKRAAPSYLSAAGKTGTAQTGIIKEDETEILNAWFSGFYPAEDTKYTITVHLYDGGESSQTATTIFKKLCDQIYYLLYPNGNE